MSKQKKKKRKSQSLPKGSARLWAGDGFVITFTACADPFCRDCKGSFGVAPTVQGLGAGL